MLEPIDEMFGEEFGQNEEEKELFSHVMALSRKGHLAIDLKKHLGREDQFENRPNSPVIFDNGYFYLERNNHYEKMIVKGLSEMIQKAPLDYLPYSDGLSDEQMKALQMAFDERCMVISGGPGCGKTFIAAKIIEEMINMGDVKVALTAPTGKAVENLRQNLTHLPTDSLQFGTLHSLLKLKKMGGQSERFHSIEANLIVVDECSMIDVKVFAMLLQSLHPSSRLILLGDPHQLPPVEAGTIFHDLVQLEIPHVHLTRCYRLESEAIAAMAHAIVEAPIDEVMSQMKLNDIKDFSYEPIRFINPTPDQYREIEDAFSKRKILCSHNKGKWGTAKMNAKCLDDVLKDDPDEIALPIIVLQNYPKYHLMNGTQGIWIKKREGDDQLVFKIENSYVTYPKPLIPRIDLAFAITIHKSQGSEYQAVDLILSDELEGFGKEALYTGVTRCKKGVEIYASEEMVKTTLQTTSLKDSSIKERMSLLPCNPT